MIALRRPRVVRVLAPFAAGIVLAAALSALAKEQETLPVLRRKLLEARTEPQIGQALDKLTANIAKAGFYADHAAFGDWLATIPDGRADHPLVRLRRGWAYVRAKRGAEAIAHLEAAMKNDPGSGRIRAYFGEALRQSNRFMDAVKMLVTARRCGETGKHVEESVRESIFGLRRSQIAGHADELPDYVYAVQFWLEISPDPMWHHTVATMLLEDWATFEKPDRDRGMIWAEVAARHALTAMRTAVAPIAGQDKLALDAAVALEVPDRQKGGKTLRFDLLAEAYRLGRLPGDGGHKYPQVITWLAEAAARENRFELAYRLAQKRLGISNSPQARRLLMGLPPDLEPDE